VIHVLQTTSPLVHPLILSASRVHPAGLMSTRSLSVVPPPTPSVPPVPLSAQMGPIRLLSAVVILIFNVQLAVSALAPLLLSALPPPTLCAACVVMVPVLLVKTVTTVLPTARVSLRSPLTSRVMESVRSVSARTVTTLVTVIRREEETHTAVELTPIVATAAAVRVVCHHLLRAGAVVTISVTLTTKMNSTVPWTVPFALSGNTITMVPVSPAPLPVCRISTNLPPVLQRATASVVCVPVVELTSTSWPNVLTPQTLFATPVPSVAQMSTRSLRALLPRIGSVPLALQPAQ